LSSIDGTLAEHRTLFFIIGGVTANNITTHPSAPRHRALAELLNKLRVAEREGIGVDRRVTPPSSTGLTLAPCGEATGRYVHDRAQLNDRVMDLVRGGEPKAVHRVVSRAKKVAAFFSISRSCRSTRFSRQSRGNSSRSAQVKPSR
jgi:hypothetical protein